MPTRFGLLLTALLATLAMTAQAASAAPITVEQVDLLGGSSPLATGQAVQRSCFDAPLPAGTPGAVRRTVTAGIGGYVDARLHGSPTGADWDLAVFDAATGKLVGASAAFGGNEVVRAPVATGEPLTVQACRYAGAAAPIDLTVTEAVVDGAVPRAEKQSLVLIKIRSQADVDRLQAAGVDLNETGTKDGIAAVLHGAGDAARVTALGLRYETTVKDLAAADATAARADAARAAPTALPSGRTSYRHLADYQMDLKRLVADHPGVVRPLILPHTSVEGRTVEGVEIATGVERTDDGRPTVFQLGLHHVREWSSGEVTIEYALDLFEPDDAADGARKQAILDGERTIDIPVVNPDGLEATQQAGDYVPADDDQGTATLGLQAEGAGSYRRKNCANDPASGVPASAPCSLQAGVDLNRNYGAFWGGPGESDDPMDQTFRGPSAFSEPEAQNIHELSSSRQVMVVNSNHNFQGDVLYQPGFNATDEPGLRRGTKVPYQDAMKALSDRAAAAAGYVSKVSYLLYDVTGATEDWNYFAQGAFGYTTEVGYDNFHPNYADAVVDEYLGTISGVSNVAHQRAPSQGMRETLLRFGEAGLDARDHATIAGTAPAGRLLRLTKDFTTSTSNVVTDVGGVDKTTGPAQLLPEHLESTLSVPPSGRYTWAVDPSTRPVELLAGRTEAWTLSCEDAATHAVLETRKVTVGIGETSAQDFACSAPAGGGTGAAAGAGAAAPPSTTSGTTSKPVVAKPKAASHAAIVILRPAFSARRTTRLGGLRLFLRLTGGSLRSVRATITDAQGHVLLAGSAAKLTRSGRVALKRRARLRPGRVTVRVAAIDAAGRKVTAKRGSRLVR